MLQDRETAIALMNLYGRNGIPFLFIIDFEMKNPLVLKENELADLGIQYSIGNSNTTTRDLHHHPLLFEGSPVPYDVYIKAFNKVKEEINAGNTYLLNLTFPTRLTTNLSLSDIFIYSNAPYKLLFANKFVVFSPEGFVTIKDNKISSFPMKGTIDASLPNAQEKILSDKKETAEHNTIVDLIRNDLSKVANNVQVEKYRYIDKIVTNNKSLLQVSSKITGELERGFESQLGDIIFSLLPAGSISGAPKKKTVEIIIEAEIIPRGYYTGVFGYYDGNNLNSAVMIRFIEKINDELVYKSGGGITFMSDAKLEYQELIDKVYVPFY